MPTVTPKAEFDRLVELLAQHPSGVAVEALLAHLGRPPSLRRPLQRRRARLVAQHLNFVQNCRDCGLQDIEATIFRKLAQILLGKPQYLA